MAETKPRSLAGDSLLQPARKLLAEWALARYLATRPPSHVVARVLATRKRCVALTPHTRTQTVSADDTVGAAMAALKRHRILSSPVIEPSNSDVAGIISVVDVLGSFLAGIYPGLLREGGSADVASRADELAGAGAEFCERKVRAIHFGGDGRLLYKARVSASLLELVTAGFLASGEHAHHRVAVWDLDGTDAHGDDAMRVTAVVSQSDVVRFLHRHADELGELPRRTLQELGLDRKPVMTLPASTPALNAFAALRTARVSAAGITAGDGGPLAANLSASDLRGLTVERWGALALPVTSFLLEQNGLDAHQAEPPEAGKVFVGSVAEGAALSSVVPLHTVSSSATFSDLLAIFQRQGVHHVWVTDDAGAPVGVITPTDVLRLVAQGMAS